MKKIVVSPGYRWLRPTLLLRSHGESFAVFRSPSSAF
jgi:hypothetical protein